MRVERSVKISRKWNLCWYYFAWGKSHFLLIIQSGQKFAMPAIRGITPKKNQYTPVTTPATINPKPIRIRKFLQNFLILLKFIS